MCRVKYVTYIIMFCYSWTSQTKQINLAKKKQINLNVKKSPECSYGLKLLTGVCMNSHLWKEVFC